MNQFAILYRNGSSGLLCNSKPALNTEFLTLLLKLALACQHSNPPQSTDYLTLPPFRRKRHSIYDGVPNGPRARRRYFRAHHRTPPLSFFSSRQPAICTAIPCPQTSSRPRPLRPGAYPALTMNLAQSWSAARKCPTVPLHLARWCRPISLHICPCYQGLFLQVQFAQGHHLLGKAEHTQSLSSHRRRNQEVLFLRTLNTKRVKTLSRIGACKVIASTAIRTNGTTAMLARLAAMTIFITTAHIQVNICRKHRRPCGHHNKEDSQRRAQTKL